MTEGQRAAKQYRMSEWSKVIKTRAESGQPVKQWCEENGVSPRVYYYRLRQVREYAASLIRSEQQSISPSGFTEVKLLEAHTSPAAKDAQLHIELGGLRITADSGYPAAELAALLRGLQ